MTEFEKLILEKLDIIIAQTAPKKKRAPTTDNPKAAEVLKLFNKYFEKSQTLTTANARCINARLKEGFTLEQFESWFIYASTDAWWKDHPRTAKITTHCNDKFSDRLDSIGLSFGDSDTIDNDEEMEM